MPRVTFIHPCVGRFPRTHYVRSWQMQPLAIAVLAGLTPPRWERRFFDDRLEAVDYDAPTDLAAISIETFTARRGYQIAAEYRRRGVPVVLGGYHATLCREEALEHADAVCAGEAEGVWGDILRDTEAGRLGGIYESAAPPDLALARPDRTIFAGKNYFGVALVETGRGCTHGCRFCSVCAFFKGTHRRRPVADVIEEIRSLGARTVFFTDDNFIANPAEARELLRALAPLGIRWISQASLDAAADGELLDLMAASGCLGLLVGLEALRPESLGWMRKKINLALDYGEALEALKRRGIVVYGTFMIGSPGDTAETAREAVRFARREKLFMAAFNHITPFPGTPSFAEIAARGGLVHERWWLSEDYRFGQAPFHPGPLTAEETAACCHRARREFYSLRSIAGRIERRANCAGAARLRQFLAINLMMRHEVGHKRGLPLGLRTRDE